LHLAAVRVGIAEPVAGSTVAVVVDIIVVGTAGTVVHSYSTTTKDRPTGSCPIHVHSFTLVIRNRIIYNL
jgi:hypothetical protein